MPDQRRKTATGDVIDRRDDKCIQEVEQYTEQKGFISAAKSRGTEQPAGDELKNTYRTRAPKPEEDGGVKKIQHTDDQTAIDDCVEGAWSSNGVCFIFGTDKRVVSGHSRPLKSIFQLIVHSLSLSLHSRKKLVHHHVGTQLSHYMVTTLDLVIFFS